MGNQFLTSAHWRQEVYRLIALKDSKQRSIEKLQQELLDVTAQIHNADGRFTQAELHEQTLREATKGLVAENKKIEEMIAESKKAEPPTDAEIEHVVEAENLKDSQPVTEPQP